MLHSLHEEFILYYDVCDGGWGVLAYCVSAPLRGSETYLDQPLLLWQPTYVVYSLYRDNNGNMVLGTKGVPSGAPHPRGTLVCPSLGTLVPPKK